MTRTDIVREGDIFVLCTDGIWEPVNDVEIARIASENTPQETCRKLVALGLERQSTDNLSVQVIKVIDPEHDNVAEAANSVPWWKRVGEFVKRGSKTKGISDSSVCS